MSADTLPRDDSSEAAIVAHVLVAPDTIGLLASLVSPAEFGDERCGWVYASALDLWSSGQPVNQITVAAAMAKRDTGNGSQLEVAGGQSWLSGCIREAIISGEESARWYAGNVRSKADLRSLIRLGSQLVTDAMGGELDAATLRDRYSEMLLRQVSQRSRATGTTPRDVILDSVGMEIELFLDDPRAIAGYPTGYGQLDGYLGGLVRTRVVVVGADTGIGKSLFVQNLARNLVVAEVPVLLFTTEMSAGEVVKRLVWMTAGIDPVYLRMLGSTSSMQRERVRDAMDRMRDLGLHIVDLGDLSLATIRSESRRYVAAHSVAVVIVDHVDMVSAEGKDKLAQLRAITAGIKAMAQDLDVCVVAVSHINRQSQRDGSLAHYSLRDSASKEQDANQIILLTPVSPDGTLLTKPQVAEWVSQRGYVPVDAHVAKNRHGPEGIVHLRLAWDQGGRFVSQEATA